MKVAQGDNKLNALNLKDKELYVISNKIEVYEIPAEIAIIYKRNENQKE